MKLRKYYTTKNARCRYTQLRKNLSWTIQFHYLVQYIGCVPTIFGRTVLSIEAVDGGLFHVAISLQKRRYITCNFSVWHEPQIHVLILCVSMYLD